MNSTPQKSTSSAKNQRKLLMSNVNPQRLYQVRQLFQFLLKVMEKIKQAKNTTPVQCLKLFMRCTTLARENLMNLQNLPPMLKQTRRLILKCHKTTQIIRLFCKITSLRFTAQMFLTKPKYRSPPSTGRG